MKYFALTIRGAEDLGAWEVQEILGVKTEELEGSVFFETDNIKEYCTKTKMAEKICAVVNEAETVEKLEVTKEDNYCPDIQNYSKYDGEKLFNEFIELKGKPNFKSPKKYTLLALPDKIVLGEDITLSDLGKRDWRIFLKSDSIRGNFAYTLIKLAGHTGKEKITDPFCKDGTIAIEAKLAGAEVYAADQNYACVNATRKNAKIAGAELKLEEKKIEEINEKADIIATIPIMPSKKINEKTCIRIYEELFKYAERADAKIVALGMRRGVEIIKTTAPWKLKEERVLRHNNDLITILVYAKV